MLLYTQRSQASISALTGRRGFARKDGTVDATGIALIWVLAVATGVAVFSGLTNLVIDHGWVGRSQVPVSELLSGARPGKTVVWHLFDMIPLISLNDAIGWGAAPLAADQFERGWLLAEWCQTG